MTATSSAPSLAPPRANDADATARLAAAAEQVGATMALFGLTTFSREGGERSGDEEFGEAVDVAVGLREEVRRQAKAALSGEGDAKELAVGLLKLCDEVRDVRLAAPPLNIQVEDKPDGSSQWLRSSAPLVAPTQPTPPEPTPPVSSGADAALRDIPLDDLFKQGAVNSPLVFAPPPCPPRLCPPSGHTASHPSAQAPRSPSRHPRYAYRSPCLHA